MYYQRHLAYRGIGWGGEEWGLKFKKVVHVYISSRGVGVLSLQGETCTGVLLTFSAGG